MKKLIFIRHGRAEDPAPEISDFERSLTLKGKVISKQMAHRFREKENDPGLMISSPAFRAFETACIFAGVSGIKPETIIINSNLYYMATIKTLFDILAKAGDEIDVVTLFGHNPAFTELPDRLCKKGCAFVTKTGIVCISFRITKWSDLKLDTGKLEYFLKPEKQL
jgi:phosphohistidine phosphatase